MVRRTTYSAWDCQAVRAHIRIVPSAPLNVRGGFERPFNTHEKGPTRPKCFCSPEHLPTWARTGTVCDVGGHYALLPVHILHNGAPLRGTDPLPCSGAKSRQRAVTGLLDVARTLHVEHTCTHATIKQALPETDGDSPPLLRTRVTAIADSLSSVACIRAADKAHTMLFAFCRQLVWDQTISFLEKEKYSAQSLDHTDYPPCILLSARTNGIPTPHDASPSYICSSRPNHSSKEQSYGDPSLQLSNHRFQRFYLRNAAQAFTLFLRLPVEEIMAFFLVLRICDLQPWVHSLSDWGCTSIAECDCSGQFNNVTPLSVMRDMSAAIKWLAAKPRWNAKEVVWSIHRDNKHFDCAGVGTTSRFFQMTHADLENLVYFSLWTDTYIQASGRLWSRTGAIPMGVPFSAQSADWRSVWGAKTRVDLMRQLGQLTFSPRGHPLWSTPRGSIISLAQFRDNVLLGARGPTALTEMQHVCDVLSKTGSLPVLCDCMTEDDRVCKRTCMQPTITAMGFTVHVHGDSPPLVYSQPSGLTSTWHLKYTVILQSPPTHAHKHMSNIIVSAVLNIHPFLHIWAGCLLSIASWAQLACLSGYPQSIVLRALHSAVPRIISRTPWDVDSTLPWCCHVVYFLACTCDTVFFRLGRWLQAHVYGLLQRMPLGTCPTRGHAAPSVPTGATIFLYSLVLHLSWIHMNSSERGSAPGGRGDQVPCYM